MGRGGRAPTASAHLLPWMKFCSSGGGQWAASLLYRRGRKGRVRRPVVSAVPIEREGEAKKLLRVTLPLGMQLPQGTRIIVD